MIYGRVASFLDAKKLTELAIQHQVLLIDPAKVPAIQSLELADYLAKSAFGSKTNIASKPHLEFLLWLAARKDISAAIRSMAFVSPQDILVVGFGTEREFETFLKSISAKRLPLGLEKKAKPEELERISLSRVAN